MKIKEGFILRRVARTYMAIPEKEEAGQKRSVVTMSGSGAFLWRLLEKGATKQELLEALVCEYDVDKGIADSDIDEFIKALSDKNLLEE